MSVQTPAPAFSETERVIRRELRRHAYIAAMGAYFDALAHRLAVSERHTFNGKTLHPEESAAIRAMHEAQDVALDARALWREAKS